MIKTLFCALSSSPKFAPAQQLSKSAFKYSVGELFEELFQMFLHFVVVFRGI